jgi:hypothetical protein
MRFLSTASRSIPFVLLGVLLAAPACESSPPPKSATSVFKPAEITNEYDARAQVIEVSQPDRKVTLRRGDGTVFEVVAPEAVRNFDQISVGKVLHVHYRESVKATLLPPGTELKVTDAAFDAGRAPVGAKPAAGTAAAIGVRVRIASIDREHEIVTYELPSGEVASRKVQTDQGRELVKTLKVGDILQLDIQQNLALSID